MKLFFKTFVGEPIAEENIYDLALSSTANFINSKPCCDCECFLNKCMNKYGLKNVYYTS